ncbi:MAG: 1-deoxy-D-xylulose-5-phosphate synthase, partial [Clostridia bacterium]|nr:1-deoxy-D-xylulose-5-phosphate synthase [Clostridia bacterium]
MKRIVEPAEIKNMSVKELEALAAEIREEIIDVTSKQGGHLASGLGATDLIVALHYAFDAPEDRIVYDVGHQTYAHKLLTGRLDAFQKLRHRGGTSGFPNMNESEYDCVTAGHASAAISTALGLARARDIMHADYHVVSVVGDGALSGGMCYEALNDAGHTGTKMIVILNDNEMSISRNVGAMSGYLTHLRQSRGYNALKRGMRKGLARIPVIGPILYKFLLTIRDSIKRLFVDDKFFDALGFVYMGPIDGHNIKKMIRVFRRAKESDQPVLLHVVTQKGRGYTPAEDHPDKYHGVAPFRIDVGAETDAPNTGCGAIASRVLSEMADDDIRITAITAAMSDGTGLELFAKQHPDRFFDVGIAEEHAVTMAAGLASEGMKPYVGISSTFLERAYDQILIDVCR